jgi:hypothetical protein
MLRAGSLEAEFLRFKGVKFQHSLVLLKMGQIIARNMLS